MAKKEHLWWNIGMNEENGQRLRRLREAQKLTQTELGDLVGLKQTTIGMIERVKRGYGISVVKIAAALGVTPEELQGSTAKPLQSVRTLSVLGEQLALTFDELPEDRVLRNRAYIAASQVLISFLPATSDDPATPALGQRVRLSTLS